MSKRVDSNKFVQKWVDCKSLRWKWYLMMDEISRSYAPNSMVDQQPEKERKTIEGDQGWTG